MPRIKKIREFDYDDTNIVCAKMSSNNKCPIGEEEEMSDKCPLYREGECKAYLFKQLERVQNEIYDYFKEEKVELK